MTIFKSVKFYTTVGTISWVLFAAITFFSCKKSETDPADLVTGTYSGQERDIYSDITRAGDTTLHTDTTYTHSIVVKKSAKDSILFVATFNWHGLDTLFTHTFYTDGRIFKYGGNQYGFFAGDSIILQVSWGISEPLRLRSWMNVFRGKK